MTLAMTEPSIDQTGRPVLHDTFDEAGRVWLDEIVRAFNDGDYTQAVDALLADEAAAPGAVDE